MLNEQFDNRKTSVLIFGFDPKMDLLSGIRLSEDQKYRDEIATELNLLELCRTTMWTQQLIWLIEKSRRMRIDRDKMNQKRIFKIRNGQINVDLGFVQLSTIAVESFRTRTRRSFISRC